MPNKKKVNKKKIISDPVFEKLKRQTTDFEKPDPNLLGLSLFTSKGPPCDVVKSSSNPCLSGIIKRRAMARIKFMNKK